MTRWQQRYQAGCDTDGRNGGAERTAWEALFGMKRFYCRAGEQNQGTSTLVLDSATALDRVSLPIVCAWATHFDFTRTMLRVLCGYFEHRRCVHVEGCVAEPLQTITAILPGSKWSCLHLRIVLQDALSEVMKVYPTLKLKVFVDELTAFMVERNKELASIAEKVLKLIKEEVQENGFEVVNRRRRERKQEQRHCLVIWKRSSRNAFFFQKNKRQASKTPGVNLRTRQLGAKVEERRKKCDVRFSLIRKNRAFQKNYMRTGVRKLLRTGLVTARAWGGRTVGIATTERLKLRRQMAAASKNEFFSLPVCE